MAMLIWLSVSGCKAKVDDAPDHEAQVVAAMKQRAPIADKYRAAAKPRFELVRAIGLDAKAAAPVTSREPLTAPVAMAEGNADSDVVTINLENLLDPAWENPAKVATGQAGEAAMRSNGNTTARLRNLEPYMAKSELRDGIYAAENFEKDFLWFAALKYLVVVRIREFRAPKAIGLGEFVTGKLSGDVIVYQIERRARVGGTPFEIEQSDRAIVSKGDQSKQLATDFDVESTAALRELIRAYLANKPT